MIKQLEWGIPNAVAALEQKVPEAGGAREQAIQTIPKLFACMQGCLQNHKQANLRAVGWATSVKGV
eukprot:1158242-Pelagomonas_calceolata.AAC.3